MPSPQLGSRHCLTLEVDVGEPFGSGGRRCVPLLGGRFEGDLRGVVVPGGADWQTVLPDGTVELSAHYALRTTSGALIEVTSVGVRHASPEVLARLERGESVPWTEYYFRTHMRWRTGATELAHWNTRLLVSQGERRPTVVHLEVFEVV